MAISKRHVKTSTLQRPRREANLYSGANGSVQSRPLLSLCSQERDGRAACRDVSMGRAVQFVRRQAANRAASDHHRQRHPHLARHVYLQILRHWRTSSRYIAAFILHAIFQCLHTTLRTLFHDTLAGSPLGRRVWMPRCTEANGDLTTLPVMKHSNPMPA